MINLSKPFGEYTHELIANLPIHINARLGDEHYIKRQVNRDHKYKPEIDRKISETVKDLIHKLLEPNPELRITAEEVLSHRWLQ
jgi:serine/threonine protein kinase